MFKENDVVQIVGIGAECGNPEFGLLGTVFDGRDQEDIGVWFSLEWQPKQKTTIAGGMQGFFGWYPPEELQYIGSAAIRLNADRIKLLIQAKNEELSRMIAESYNNKHATTFESVEQTAISIVLEKIIRREYMDW